MVKIAFLTDIHANLPALEAVLKKIEKIKCDEIIIGGDSIGIGPFPAETLSRLMNLPYSCYINGNHEFMAIHGFTCLDAELIKTINEGEKEHTNWYTSQLDTTMDKFLNSRPLSVKKVVEGVPCHFLHYGLDPKRTKTTYPFKHEKLNEKNVSQLFSELSGSLVGFGHVHKIFEVKENNCTYFTPGSLGCFDKSIARFATIDFFQGQFEIQKYAVKYDDSELYKEFEKRNVPDRKFIYKTFFGGRFTVK